MKVKLLDVDHYPLFVIDKTFGNEYDLPEDLIERMKHAEALYESVQSEVRAIVRADSLRRNK